MQPNKLSIDRLARRLSLKSFRKSQVNPKENLPEDYCSIFHFQTFKGDRIVILSDAIDKTNDSIDDYHKDYYNFEMKDNGSVTNTPSRHTPVGTHAIIDSLVNTTTNIANIL